MFGLTVGTLILLKVVPDSTDLALLYATHLSVIAIATVGTTAIEFSYEILKWVHEKRKKP